MKIVSATRSINESTFQPLIKVIAEFDVSLELLMDTVSTNSMDLKTELGKLLGQELIEAMEQFSKEQPQDLPFIGTTQ
jgi:hypothetical protein